MTLIGTSTNLVVAGLSKERYGSDTGECISPDGTSHSQEKERERAILVFQAALALSLSEMDFLKSNRDCYSKL